MWPFSQWTTAGRAALTYITIGALIMVWAGIWYVYLFNDALSENGYYWCTGFMVTGLIMVLIGSGLAMISRAAAQAELPPAGGPVAVVNVQPNVASVPAPAPVNLAKAAHANGQVALPPPKTRLPG